MSVVKSQHSSLADGERERERGGAGNVNDECTYGLTIRHI